MLLVLFACSIAAAHADDKDLDIVDGMATFHGEFYEMAKSDPFSHPSDQPGYVTLNALRIEIQLPVNRERLGLLWVKTAQGKTLFGPIGVLGRANQAEASRKGNGERDPTRENGDTPAGNFNAHFIAPEQMQAQINNYSQSSYGTAGAIYLKPHSGLALVAFGNGRYGLMIHSGDLKDGALKPTLGCIRVDNEDMADLAKILSDGHAQGRGIKFVSIKEQNFSVLDYLAHPFIFVGKKVIEPALDTEGDLEASYSEVPRVSPVAVPFSNSTYSLWRLGQLARWHKMSQDTYAAIRSDVDRINGAAAGNDYNGIYAGLDALQQRIAALNEAVALLKSANLHERHPAARLFVQQTSEYAANLRRSILDYRAYAQERQRAEPRRRAQREGRRETDIRHGPGRERLPGRNPAIDGPPEREPERRPAIDGPPEFDFGHLGGLG